MRRWLLAVWLWALPVHASVMARIDHAWATGEGKRPAFVIDLYRGVGFDVSLLATGEQIVDWWVDDPSRVLARTDRSGRVLNLRLVDLPALLPTNRTWTALKLVVQDTRGSTSLMYFIVRFQPQSAIRADQLRFHGVEILPTSGAASAMHRTPTTLR